jgi:hypothetical protein
MSARAAIQAAAVARAAAASVCLRAGVAPAEVARLARLAGNAARGAAAAERDATQAAITAERALTRRMRSTALLIEDSSRATAQRCVESALRLSDEAILSLRGTL